MTNNGKHAVVIGASVAGLLAARAVAEYFDQVTIVEKEVLPPPGEARRAVPQGRHVHALLPGGLQAIDQLLPGFQAELVAAGAVRCDSMKEIRFVVSGHQITREAGSSTNILASRPFIEGHIRRRVLAVPNVRMLDGMSALGLAAGPDGQSVAGVRLADRVLASDLVVVATGRTGPLSTWLERLGFAPPHEDELSVDIQYASRHLKISDTTLGSDKLILIGAEPHRPRGMGLFKQEDGTWLLTMVGYGPDHRPPTDDVGYLAFVGSVAPPDVFEALRLAEPLDAVVTHAFPASRRRRYERLRRFPEGLIVAGDAICSFNPVYGQGMSVAALEAVELQKCLARGVDRLAGRYFKASAKVVDVAWDLAVGSDLSLPEIVGKRPLAIQLSNAWAELVLRAAEKDAKVAEVFGSVTDHLAPPTVLLHPKFVWRVLRNQPRAHGTRQSSSAAPARPFGAPSTGIR
jgi:2-polyprenyl-6-methoxyphenol hydroxylase-like FAD-dependent oxidoreductase